MRCVSLFAESGQTGTRDLGQFSADECRSRDDAESTKSGPAIVCSWRQAAGSLVQCFAGIAADSAKCRVVCGVGHEYSSIQRTRWRSVVVIACVSRMYPLI